MQTISQTFPTRAAAIAALKAASPLLVNTDAAGGDRIVEAGFDAAGARFDLLLTDLSAPTGQTVAGPNGEQVAEIALTGEVQVDLVWQGETPPALSGAAASAPAIEIAPPVTPIAPPAPQPISWLDFMGLFAPAEQAAIAISVDPAVAVFRMMAMGLGGDLNFADPRIGLGLDALVAAGLIAPDRKAQVLARQQP